MDTAKYPVRLVAATMHWDISHPHNDPEMLMPSNGENVKSSTVRIGSRMHVTTYQ